MNLRNVDKYSIGLDIGTGSVGWAVIDENGNLLHFKGRPTWGSRIFPSADPAAEARGHRGQRRRYQRRRWRLDLLEGLFAAEVAEVDPDFFARLRQTALLKEDRSESFRDSVGMLFQDSDFSERDYFKRFPTIYHLRKWLMETDEKADIRLIYLAFHNIVKHRGNFLQQDQENLSSENASVRDSAERLCLVFQEFCDEMGVCTEAMANKGEITSVLGDSRASRSQLKDSLVKLFAVQVPDDGDDVQLDRKQAQNMAKALAAALVGLKAKMGDIFFVVEEPPQGIVTDLYLSNDEQVEQFSEVCPDSGIALFEAMQAVYSSFVLQEILSSAPGCTISANKVEDYKRYGEDLAILKDLVRRYVPEKYSEFFRGPFCEPSVLHPQKSVYDKYGKDAIKGYTRYNEVRGWKYDDFKKEVEKLFQGTDALGDDAYLDMMKRFGEGKFLRRLKTSDNGAIPFQLHREEMRAIIENQKKHYGFLDRDRKKLESLVSFRIPYYVGPLTQKNARKDEAGVPRFAWSCRVEGQEDAKVYPWNWEEVIDKDRSATAFIQRMTSTCTYLQGEPVLPKCSLLYEEFCVLNELNGAKFTRDGDRWHRFDYRDRSDIVDQLFKRGRVSYKKVADWMSRERGEHNAHVAGGQGESGFESKLSSYLFFAKDVFGVEEIPESDYPMIEEIILWSTIFEDRAIFREKLERNYGNRLDEDQIKKIVRKRFSGWGRLSKKFLCGIKAKTDCGPCSIMDVLREGNPNSNTPSRAMVLMEVLHDDSLNFGDLVDTHNNQYLLGATQLCIGDLPGSPALRRSVNQSLRIVDEIVGVVGHAPENIFIEVTREDDLKKRGHRTKRRYDSLKEQMAALKQQAPELWDGAVAAQLSEKAASNADLTEKLTLYFMQNGKSLYSGAPLDIEQLATYQVDHIIPQAYIKDDSFENKALVLPSENQRKSDQMLLDRSVRVQMKPYWDALYEAKLIGEKKHRNLLRDHVSESQMKGFIARQLVETSQVMKIVQEFLRQKYEETGVLPVKAGLSSELRRAVGLVKCREANDYHHAHDALLAAEIGRFIIKRHEGMYERPVEHAHVMKSFIRSESERLRKGGRPKWFSFVISSFMSPGFDEETGELFKDDWSPSREIARLKEYFNYRQCFISRMPEETSGAFWDATVYSPRDASKNMTLPLKAGLAPEKYGSYSREQYAYFFIYRALKKDKQVFEFAAVPVRVAAALIEDSGALVSYAQGLAEEKGLVFLEVVRSKIYKYQLMEFDGSRLYLTGFKEARNATQFAFTLDEVGVLESICDEEGEREPTSDAQLDGLFETAYRSLERYSPKLFSAIGIGEWRERFFSLGHPEKESVILALVAIGNGKANMVDLRVVGSGKCVGNMRFSYGKLLCAKCGLTFIDQSVTGMFEGRTHIGL